MYTILSISDSDKHFDSAIQEYIKRMWKTLTIKNIKPTKHGTQKQSIQKDTAQIISVLERQYSSYKKILLSKEGKVLDTMWFKKTIHATWNIVFLIGGPYGFDESILFQYVDEKVSFGAMTMPHGLVKLVVLEQIYRAESIRIGKKYHY
jgi:23S rRNA (pseudouridine1915-N3)-methyltransferase